MDVPSHPLLVIDYGLLRAGDITERDRLWQAATSIGFCLKDHGADKEVSAMFEMGSETMALPDEEKRRFEHGDVGRYFGYKKIGGNAIDATGLPDTNEFIYISKDDALAFPNVVHRTYPAPTTAAIPTAVAPFVRKFLEVGHTMLRVFNDKLGLPEGTLDRLHPSKDHSNGGARAIRFLQTPFGKTLGDRATLGVHTDFGSLSFVNSNLGGLQVMPPGCTEWSYVKPLPGHTICNIGDALSIFSGGIFQSNLHRVVTPPGIQGGYERWTVVYFMHPGDSQILRPLVNDSPMIADAVRERPNPNFDTGLNAAEWFAKRAKNRKADNTKDPAEAWAASKGTEHSPTAA